MERQGKNINSWRLIVAFGGGNKNDKWNLNNIVVLKMKINI